MNADIGLAADSVAVGVRSGSGDSGHGTSDWKFERWDEDQTRWVQRKSGLATPPGQAFRDLKVTPYSVTGFHGNVITNAGWQAILALATTGAGTVYSSTKGRIGAGDGTTAVAATDPDFSAIAGSTHRWFQLCGAAPTVGAGANRTWTFVATFGTADGNFAWQEFGVDSGTASGNTVTAALLNHALSNQGTKVAGQTWTATAQLSFT